MMLGGFPGASYDAWKTTPPDRHVPFHVARCAEETEWRMRKLPGWHYFDGDEAKYEYLCEEWDELARIDAHERAPDDEDFEDLEAA